MKTKNKFSRSDYLDNKCSHDDYYGQFVNEFRKATVARIIGTDNIKNSKDPHFNDIPLHKWDSLPANCTDSEMKEVGDFYTLSGKVCIAKACAKQIRGF